MKKLILAALVFIALFSITKAQQLPLYSQYMMNGFLLNPAMAGSVDYVPVRLTARQQWTGIKDAPSTQAISAHGLLNNQKMGVGGYIFNDHFGPISNTGIQASYAYHIPISGEMKLGLGISFSAFQFKIDESNLHAIDNNDAALTGATEKVFVPDANFGAYLYSDRFFVGLSGAQLIQYKIKLNDQLAGNNQMIRHYYLTGGYTFSLNDDFNVQPSLMIKGTEKSPINLDFNIKAIYKQNYWLGISYRTSESIVAILGLKVDRYYIGYAFDYTFSTIKNYSSGSHEIMIGINLGEGANHGSSLL